MMDEGLADVEAADPFRLPRLHQDRFAGVASMGSRAFGVAIGLRGGGRGTFKRDAVLSEWVSGQGQLQDFRGGHRTGHKRNGRVASILSLSGPTTTSPVAHCVGA
jgi:hypothetical protein